MIGSIAVLLTICAVTAVLRVRRARRRRAEAATVITSWPDIELSQIYGGWNAEAYDAGTGHDHTPRPFSRTEVTAHSTGIVPGRRPR